MRKSIFYRTFAANLAIKNEINKKMSKNLTQLELQFYYSGLSKKDKGDFMLYLTKEYEYKSSTLQKKLTGVLECDKRDLILIGDAVQSEAWRNQ